MPMRPAFVALLLDSELCLVFVVVEGLRRGAVAALSAIVWRGGHGSHSRQRPLRPLNFHPCGDPEASGPLQIARVRCKITTYRHYAKLFDQILLILGIWPVGIGNS